MNKWEKCFKYLTW